MRKNLMKLNMRILLATMGVAALTVGMAQPASAATTGETLTSLNIQGGSLSITVPESASLGTKANSVSGREFTSSLGQVTVSDARSAAAGSTWNASAVATAFTPPSGTAIAASAISYSAGSITKVGTATFTATNLTSMSAAAVVVAATGITGDNSAVWNPTITVDVPGGMAANAYYATITHSVY